MSPGPGGEDTAIAGQGEARYHKRDFWADENLKYAKPHFRMRKVAREVRRIARGRIARGRECDLLDLGCGPAALAGLMPPGVRYHGIDIAIPRPAPNLIELDILEEPVGFRGQTFDVVVAQGLFEYVGEFQAKLFAEIAGLLNDGGTFILTYQNFDHRKREIYGPYSNVQRPGDFRRELSRFFTIERSYPGSHNWNHSQPGRTFMKVSQARLALNIPVISPILAVDYFYLCTPRMTER